jgi:septal ring factor EnvC (AmiA/AmiB activator)
MKKNVIYVLLLSVVALCSCGHNKTENVAQQRDSLMNEDNRMNEFLDIVSVSMDSINGKESCLFLSKEGKPLSNKEQIRDNIKLFKYTLDQQRKRIADLEAQLGQKNDARTQKLRSIIKSMQAQLDEKDAMISQLTEELNQKNTDIASLQAHVSKLNNHVSTLTNQVGELNKANQDKDANIEKANNEIAQMSVGYVKIGTKRQLSDAGMLRGGLFQKKRLDLSNIDNSAFNSVDIRNFSELSIPGKKVTVITQHPASSYSLEANGSTTILKVSNSSSFWSTSHYLVIMYK